MTGETGAATLRNPVVPEGCEPQLHSGFILSALGTETALGVITAEKSPVRLYPQPRTPAGRLSSCTSERRRKHRGKPPFFVARDPSVAPGGAMNVAAAWHALRMDARWRDSHARQGSAGQTRRLRAGAISGRQPVSQYTARPDRPGSVSGLRSQGDGLADPHLRDRLAGTRVARSRQRADREVSRDGAGAVRERRRDVRLFGRRAVRGRAADARHRAALALHRRSAAPVPARAARVAVSAICRGAGRHQQRAHPRLRDRRNRGRRRSQGRQDAAHVAGRLVAGTIPASHRELPPAAREGSRRRARTHRASARTSTQIVVGRRRGRHPAAARADAEAPRRKNRRPHAARPRRAAWTKSSRRRWRR